MVANPPPARAETVVVVNPHRQRQFRTRLQCNLPVLPLLGQVPIIGSLAPKDNRMVVQVAWHQTEEIPLAAIQDLAAVRRAAAVQDLAAVRRAEMEEPPHRQPARRQVPPTQGGSSLPLTLAASRRPARFARTSPQQPTLTARLLQKTDSCCRDLSMSFAFWSRRRCPTRLSKLWTSSFRLLGQTSVTLSICRQC